MTATMPQYTTLFFQNPNRFFFFLVNKISRTGLRPCKLLQMVREATFHHLLLRIIHLLSKRRETVCSDHQLQPFYVRRSSLSEVDSCILITERVVVPSKLQLFVIKRFHLEHQGIKHIKVLASS